MNGTSDRLIYNRISDWCFPRLLAEHIRIERFKTNEGKTSQNDAFESMYLNVLIFAHTIYNKKWFKRKLRQI